MKRSSTNTTVAFVLGALGFLTLTSETQSLIIDIRDSSDFVANGISSYEGDVLPTIVGNAGDFSTDDDILTIANSNTEGENFFTLDGTVGAEAYTVEARFRVTSGAAKTAALSIVSGNNSQFFGADLFADRVANILDNGGQFFLGDFTDVFHTVRIAVQSDAETTKTAHLYIDDEEITDTLTSTFDFTLDRILFGDDGGSITSGSIQLDYLRIDNTGAYAPIPEPSALVVLTLGLSGLAATRQRKK